jgi:hypothetical protein
MKYVGFLVLSLLTLAGAMIAASGLSSLQADYAILSTYAGERLEGQDPELFLAQLMQDHRSYLRRALAGLAVVVVSTPLWGIWRRRYIWHGASGPDASPKAGREQAGPAP